MALLTDEFFPTLFKESKLGQEPNLRFLKLQVHEPINSIPKLLYLSACRDRWIYLKHFYNNIVRQQIPKLTL